MKLWLVRLSALVSIALFFVAAALSYEITRFSFGPHVYSFSEPTVDIEKFHGPMSPVIVEDEWAVVIWEGSDPTQDQWAMIGTLFERQGPKGSIIFVQISTGISSGDPDKMKSTTFVDLQFMDTGTPSYKLTKVEKFENFDKLLEIMRAKYAKKLSI